MLAKSEPGLSLLLIFLLGVDLAGAGSLNVDSRVCRGIGTTLDAALLVFPHKDNNWEPWMNASQLDGKNETEKHIFLATQLQSIWNPKNIDDSLAHFKQMASKDLIETTSLVAFLKNTHEDWYSQNNWNTSTLDLKTKLVDFLLVEKAADARFEENYKTHLNKLDLSSLLSITCDKDWDFGSFTGEPIAFKDVVITDLPADEPLPTENILSLTKVGVRSEEPRIFIAILFPSSFWMVSMELGSNGSIYRYVDHIKWSKCLVGECPKYLKQYSKLVFIPTYNQTSLEKTAAVELNVLPIFLTMDNTTRPDNEEADSALAAVPIPGGSWENHILIHHEKSDGFVTDHEGKRYGPFFQLMKTDLSLIRVGKNGKLSQIFEEFHNNFHYNFQAVLPASTVQASLSFFKARSSYVVYGLNNKVTGYKVRQTTQVVNEKSALTELIEAKHFDTNIAMSNVLDVVLAQNMFKLYLVVLEEVSDSSSKVKVFDWTREYREVYHLNGETLSELKLPDTKFSRMKFFKTSLVDYIIFFSTSKASLYEIRDSGKLVPKQDFVIEDILDVLPVESNSLLNQHSLVFIQKTGVEVYILDFPAWKKMDYATLDGNNTLSGSSTKTFSNYASAAALLGGNNNTVESLKELTFGVGKLPSVNQEISRIADLEAKVEILKYKKIKLDISNRFTKLKDQLDNVMGNHHEVNLIEGSLTIKHLQVQDELVLPMSSLEAVEEIRLNMNDSNTQDIKPVLNIDFVEVNKTLNEITSNLDILEELKDDVLLLDNDGKVQNVTNELRSDSVEANEIMFKSGSNVLKLEKLGSKDGDLMDIHDLQDFYSLHDRQDTTIEGLKTFHNKVSFIDLHTTNVQFEKNGISKEISIPNLLTYEGSQEVAAFQTFLNKTKILDSLTVGENAFLKNEDATIDVKKDIVEAQPSLSGFIKFQDKVLVAEIDNDGRINNLTQSSQLQNILLSTDKNPHMKGKIEIRHPEQNGSMDGTIMELNVGKLNNVNIKDIFDNAAWSSCPQEQDFCEEVQFEKQVTVNGDIKVDRQIETETLNNVKFENYVNFPNICTNPRRIDGKKTFKEALLMEKLSAKSINGILMGNLVTKSTDQDIHSKNRFKQGISVANDIIGSENLRVDGVDLKELLTSNFTELAHKLEEEIQDVKDGKYSHLHTIIMKDGTKVTVDGAFNDVEDLSEIIADVVNKTDSDISINGTATFPLPVEAGPVTVDQIKTGDDLEFSYTTEDFMNRNIDQTIKGVKTFQKPVTFSDMKMAGPYTTLDGPVAAQVINNWINKEDMVIKHKLAFENLQTDSFEVSGDAKLNGLDASVDLALLDRDNVFCDECTQTFGENLKIKGGQVSDLNSASDIILGVNVTHVDQTRVRTEGEQTLYGKYHFENLIHDSGVFNADICASEALLHSEGEFAGDICLKDFEDKFLKTDGDEQTLAGNLHINSLTTSDSLELQTGKINVVKDNLTKSIDIKALFKDAFVLDQPRRIKSDFKFEDSVEVVESITVKGKVDNVDVSALASDAVVKGYQDGANEVKTVITGKKNFTVPPTVSGTVYANDKWDGIVKRVLTKSSNQDMNATLTVDGNVTAANVTVNGLFNNVNLSAYDNFDFDHANQTYIWKGDLELFGDLEIKNLVATKVNGRDFNKFVEDSISLSDLEVSLGSKTFSSVVFKNPISTESINNMNIVELNKDCADVRNETVFLKKNTFLSQSPKLKSLHVTDKLVLQNSNIGEAININWIKNNFVKSSSPEKQIISGKVIFEENLQTAKNVNISSLSDLDEKVTVTVPEDLIHVEADDEISLTSAQGSTRLFAGVEILANSSIAGKVVGHEFDELTNLLYTEGDQIITGQKNFLGTVKAENRDTRVVTVNGLRIPSDLVWLHQRNFLNGSYSFENISTTDLKLDGLIDGVNFTHMVQNLLTTDTDQTITEVYRFNKGATFKDIRELGNRPLISGMKPKKLKNIQEVYDTLYAAKLSAQAETASLCRKVAEVGSSYLSSYEVKYFETTGSVELMEGMELTAVEQLHVAGNIFALLGGQDGEGCSSVTLFEFVDHELIEISRLELMEHTAPKTANFYPKPASCLKRKISSISAIPLVPTLTNNHMNHAVIVTPESRVDDEDDQLDGVYIVKVTGSANNVTGLELEEVGMLANVISFSAIVKRSHVFLLDRDPLDQTLGLSYILMEEVSNCLLKDVYEVTCEVDPKPIWRSDYPSVSRRGISPKLDILEFPAGDQIIAAFFDDTTEVSTPVIRLVAVTEDFLLESDYAISKDSHDFALISRRREIVLVTASSFGLTVNQVDFEEETFSPNQVIYSNRTIEHVMRQRDFLGERNLMTVLERSQGQKESSIAFYEHKGTMGLQLKRRVKIDIPAKEMNLIQDVNDYNVAVQLTVTGNDKIRVLEGVMPDLSAIATISNLEHECLDPVVERSFSSYVANPYCEMSPLHTRCRYADQSVSCDIKNNWVTEKLKKVFVEVHNEERKKIAKGELSSQPQAANMKKLKWNEEIALSAQLWADQCNPGFDDLKHRTKLTGDLVGQNIMAFYQVRADFRMDEDHIYDSVRAWSAQAHNFNQDYISPFKFTKSANEYQMYSQLAWADTDEVGCGWTLYKAAITSDQQERPYVSWIVCNYHVSGNVPQEVMYHAGVPCSMCPSGWVCEDGALCKDPSVDYETILP